LRPLRIATKELDAAERHEQEVLTLKTQELYRCIDPLRDAVGDMPQVVQKIKRANDTVHAASQINANFKVNTSERSIKSCRI